MKTGVYSLKNWLFLAFFWIVVSTQAFASSPVWQVKKGDHQLFLGGTIHLLRGDDYPLPKAFEYAYARTDTVILETDVGGSSQPEFRQQMLNASRLPKGQRLDQILSESTWSQLLTRIRKMGLDEAHFTQLRPAIVAMSLTLLELRQLGVTGSGVDLHFYQRARSDGKTLEYLETLQQQLLFLNQLGEESADDIILQTLEEIRHLANQFEQMVSNWRSGQKDRIYQLFVAPLREDFPDIYQRILVQRNQDWMSQIIDHLESPEVELILVGSAHLVGPDGLLRLLADRGYQLSQIE
jgi:hypothetical protein